MREDQGTGKRSNFFGEQLKKLDGAERPDETAKALGAVSLGISAVTYTSLRDGQRELITAYPGFINAYALLRAAGVTERAAELNEDLTLRLGYDILADGFGADFALQYFPNASTFVEREMSPATDEQ